ncbi:cytochrome d ubiquinol oxidase subunit II [Kineococcus rhizosphaerae]|uniref:Cytochrome bd-I ubiquinol oxidase subunit 2 apoprotein n=1 Tax=Kineococcus rhizosphaerae TaxID=559628 RepID=A0A2T0RAQ2_9ACTN|nr:cytochrome d ubiquinol oxidase subunit II [Kineococcus rhizosphaerae]PRY18233.1 cytochrome bd-I ubiquinol oxidase subunit 2 apoprotein [Kineococcus rhizosphaerae]
MTSWLDLPVFWYCVTVLAWVLFFVLEGFDFGVGFLGPLLGRTEAERGAAVRTVGPVWDGNEVWLVAAIGVTFAAFPDWYAALLSGAYLPMIAILLLLAVRGVAIEFRGKHDTARWRNGCDAFLAASSLLLAGTWGAVLGVLASGLALGPDGEVHGSGLTRSLAPLFGPWAVLGGFAGVLLATVHGATFLSLRTTGVLRARARHLTVATAPVLVVIALAVFIAAGHAVVAAGAALAALAAVAAWRRAEVLAFAATTTAVAGTVVAVFTAHLGEGSWVLLRSTLSPAGDVTLRAAAASDGALHLITAAGLVILPGVIAYQAWSYVVFRRRVATGFPAARRRVRVSR